MKLDKCLGLDEMDEWNEDAESYAGRIGNAMENLPWKCDIISG